MVSMHQRLKREKKVNFRTARNDHFCGEMKLANLRSTFFAICSKMEGAEWKKPFRQKGKGWFAGPFLKRCYKTDVEIE